MTQNDADRSTQGSFGEISIEEMLAQPGGAGREEIVARLTHEIGCLNSALPTASRELQREMVLLVECLRAARQVVERSVNFANARDNLKEEKS